MTKTTDKTELERALRKECELSGADYDELMIETFKGALAGMRFERRRKVIQPAVKASGMPVGDEYLEQNS